MKIFVQTSLTFFLLFFLITFRSNGEPSTTEITFPSLWNQIQKNAPSEKISEYQLQASIIDKERYLRLGYPRLYLDARAFSTNDPALSFFSVLNQRQIHPSDFAPDLMNNPGYQFYQKGTLGLDWPFYDGGARSAKAESQEKVVLAWVYDQKKSAIDLYAESAVLYGSLLILENESDKLRRILDSTEKLIDQYRIGVKSNPLGYSGLLGLKTLKNRITEALIVNSAGLNSARNSLREKAGLISLDWRPVSKPKQENILPFTRQFLAPAEDQVAENGSASTRAREADAEASEKLIDVEKAKDRPRAGLFSEAALYNGNRDIASSYVLGVYFQWDLFSMDRYRQGDQAKASAMALKAKSDDLRLKEKIDRENALSSITALEKQVDLLSDSSRLLEEQAQTSKKLYQNGSLSVLQLIEVLNQEMDLIIRRMKVEMAFLTLNGDRFKISGMNIPLAAGEGAP